MDYSQFHREVHDPMYEVAKKYPHASIQWKGTNACMDMRCECGYRDHIDGEFVYHYECGECGRKYALDSHIALIPLNPEQIAFIENGGGCAFRLGDDFTEEM